jgi:hypothetical protein
LRAPEILPKTAVAPAKLNMTAIQLKENNIKANKLAELPEELNCRNGSETVISILNQTVSLIFKQSSSRHRYLRQC